MEVQAQNMTVAQMLNKGRFIIPDYQRPFDWGETEISEFLDDILANLNNDYFIGHMVFDGQMNDNEFSVVDGQQRITTLTILLCVIRDLYSQVHKDDNLTNGINSNYIFKKDIKFRDYPILKTDMPYPIFQTYVQEYPKPASNTIQPTNSGEENILNAYNYFYNKLSKEAKGKLEKIVESILKLELIFVASKGRINAHSIFMTLNAKGKDLTFVDLIKNDIFSKYKNPKSMPKKLEEKWKRICSNFGNSGEDFFLTFWKSRYKVNVSRDNLYKEYTNLATSKSFNIESFVEELLSDSELYSKIKNPTASTWINKKIPYIERVYYHLFNIKKVFNIEVVDSFLLALLRTYKENKISVSFLVKTLKKLDNFHFINNAICLNRLSGFEKLYPSHAIKLFNSQNKQQVHQELKDFIKKIDDKILPLKEFEDSFNKRVYFYEDTSNPDDRRAKKLALYCLEKLEKEAQNWNVSFHNLSLEHLHAKALINVNGFNEKLIKQLGNLVLLDRDLNSKLGDKDYQSKRDIIIKENKLITTQDVVTNYIDWNVTNLKQRNQNLIVTIYSISRK